MIPLPSRLARLAGVMLVWLALPASAQIPIQEVTSPGGIKAWLVEDHQIPFTALEIRFRGGTSLDLPEKRGATNLMAGLIEEGAGDLDARSFAEARDALAASMSFSATGDSFAVSARFLSERRDEAVDLLALALNQPRFDQDAVDRVREQVLAGLRSAERDPGQLAGKAFSAMAYGDHPYATSGDGTIESVGALTADDMRAAHKGALARDRVYVAASGDITPTQLGEIVDRLLADLPATGAPQPGPAPWQLTGGISVIDFPSPQSVVLFGQPGIGIDDPDFFAAYLLNEILGGGRFSARLMNEVRDKRGLAYGIGSWLVGMDHADALMGQFSASNDKVAEAVEVVQAEWQRIATDGVNEGELETAKTYLTGSYALRFDGNGPIASILVGMQMQGMPVDYPNSRNARIEAVSEADVQRVAHQLFKPDALRFVIAGRPERISADGIITPGAKAAPEPEPDLAAPEPEPSETDQLETVSP